MTNQERKDWGYANLKSDNLDKSAIAANIAAHGARKICEILGPTTWPETYGQTPWDDTLALAFQMVREGRDR